MGWEVGKRQSCGLQLELCDNPVLMAGQSKVFRFGGVADAIGPVCFAASCAFFGKLLSQKVGAVASISGFLLAGIVLAVMVWWLWSKKVVVGDEEIVVHGLPSQRSIRLADVTS